MEAYNRRLYVDRSARARHSGGNHSDRRINLSRSHPLDASPDIELVLRAAALDLDFVCSTQRTDGKFSWLTGACAEVF